MKLTVVGCGDAFGSGGRLQTSYYVEAGGTRFLIDCGATAMIGLNRLNIDANGIETIFVSHLHGDHFSGLVWWMLHGQHISRRTAQLTVVGPSGIASRFRTTAEALFPGCTEVPPRFKMEFIEIEAGSPQRVGPLTVTAFEVSHPSGAPALALRIGGGGRTLAFSGDTEWVEALVGCAAGADLFICECFGFDQAMRHHMNWRLIEKNIDRLSARRILLTHMGDAMLAQRGTVKHPRVALAEDGLVLDV
jgi:ribonuclease BN (tRNA processing enzyme)